MNMNHICVVLATPQLPLQLKTTQNTLAPQFAVSCISYPSFIEKLYVLHGLHARPISQNDGLP